MTLLTVAQEAANEIGVSPPAVVVGVNDETLRKLLKAINDEGRWLHRNYDWPDLVREHTFVTVSTSEQPSGFPADWHRMTDPAEVFDRTLHRRCENISAEHWQAREAQLIVPQIELFWRIRGGTFLVGPGPVAGRTLAYEYVTKDWANSSDGAGQTYAQADTDTFALPEELLASGAVWRWKKGRGLDYGEEYELHMEAVGSLFSAQSPSGRLSLHGSRRGSWDFLEN